MSERIKLNQKHGCGNCDLVGDYDGCFEVDCGVNNPWYSQNKGKNRGVILVPINTGVETPAPERETVTPQEQYESETGNPATYRIRQYPNVDYHTLRYVRWLETKVPSPSSKVAGQTAKERDQLTALRDYRKGK